MSQTGGERSAGVGGICSVVAAAGILAGITIGLLLPRTYGPGWLTLALCIGGLLWWRGGRWRWAGALLVGLGWAQWHASAVLAARLPADWEGHTAVVIGQVTGLPEHGPRRTRFVFRVDDTATLAPTLRGRRLQVVWYDAYDADEPGPRLEVQAGGRWALPVKLRAPRGLSNPGGFDSERHAFAQRIAASAVVEGRPQWLGQGAGVDVWRAAMSARIGATQHGYARFIQALALGDTRALQPEDWQVLRATGLTHLIAISGFHVGIVAACVAVIGAGLWRLWPPLAQVMPRAIAAALFAVAGAAVYAAVAGSSLPTVRTVLMIGVVAAARVGRRRASVADSLSLALCMVVLVDPLAVLLAGFWLSFAGVAWLAWCLPVATDQAPLWRSFAKAQWVATLGLLPLTVAWFGQASMVGPLSNVVAIPWWSLVVVPLALLGTALEAVIAGSGAWAWQLAGSCFGWSWKGYEVVATSPLALWWLPEARGWALLLALVGAFWMLLPLRVPGKWLAGVLWLPLLWPPQELPRLGEVELHVLDVGQGLAVVVRTARHQLLYDAGPAAEEGYDAGERVVVPALRALGVRQLDRLVVSHGDADHAGGAAAVAAAMSPGIVEVAPGWLMPGSQACVAGQQWVWDGVSFEYLHPPPHFPYLRNESSCVLRIKTATGAVLLTGDIGQVVESGLVARQREALRANVLVAPHHGSGQSSSPGFVSAVSPQLVLVSAGHGNRFGHPRAEVVRRWQAGGAEVVSTAGGGALRVWLGVEGVQLRERRPWRARLWDATGPARPAAILSGIKQAADVPEG